MMTTRRRLCGMGSGLALLVLLAATSTGAQVEPLPNPPPNFPESHALSIVVAHVGEPFAIAVDAFAVGQPRYEVRVWDDESGATVLAAIHDPASPAKEAHEVLAAGDGVDLLHVRTSERNRWPVFTFSASATALLWMQVTISGEVQETSGATGPGALVTEPMMIEILADAAGDPENSHP
jgi:hypothetical protein